MEPTQAMLKNLLDGKITQYREAVIRGTICQQQAESLMAEILKLLMDLIPAEQGGEP